MSKFQSVSTIPIIIGLNRTQHLKGEFKRHFSPSTVKNLLNIFPIYGRINRYDYKFIYVQVSLQIGSEKAINSFKKGDIAYSPLGNYICIFLEDATLEQKLNPLGRITSEKMDILQSFSVGDYLSIEKSAN